MEKTGINKNVLVVIPCYNEAGNVERLHDQLKGVQIPGCTITPLFINDCSADNTLEILKRTGVRHLNNVVNLGIGGTVQLGFIYAKKFNYDYAVQMDGDGQHPPAQLHKLLMPLLNDECDLSVGSRFIEGAGFQSSSLRRFGINFFYHLNKLLTGVNVRDATSGYRAYNRKALDELVEYYPDEYPEPEAIVYLANKGLRIKEVPVMMEERKGGVSSIRRFNSVYYMIKVSLNTIFLHLKMKLHG